MMENSPCRNRAIGANRLVNPRDFLSPAAAFEEREGPRELVAKLPAICEPPRSVDVDLGANL